MNTIIAGSRTIQSYDLVLKAIQDSGFAPRITTVLCGMASGPDILGYRWAMTQKIPVRQFVPEWSKYGKPAGIIRNAEMATYADAAIVLWDGRSTGTAHLLKYMKGLDPKVLVHLVMCPEWVQKTLVTQGQEQSKL